MNTDNMENSRIFPKGEKADANFTGDAWVQMLVSDAYNAFNTQVYDVTFAPKTRNYWHSHSGGQILLVTAGKGYYQEKGGPARLLKKGYVVEIKPNVIHWHGATPDSEFTHIGISTKIDAGAPTWYGPVTDEEYNNI